MKRLKFYQIIILIISVVIVIYLFITNPFQKTLVFQPKQSNAKPAYIPLKDETKFQIKYTHSIHLTDVVESYKIINQNQIQQYELMYEDFAIGMPSDAGKGETFEEIDGKYFIKNMKRIFPFFDLRIGQVRANHRVIFNNKEYPLSQFIEPGTLVRVEIQKLSFFQQWKGVNILESF